MYVERVAAELVAAGHRATVLCARHTEGSALEITPDGIRIIRRGGRHSVYLRAALTYLSGAFGFGQLARRRLGRPDVIVDAAMGMPFLSPLFARRPVIALVHHVHKEQWPIVLPGLRGRFGWWVESRVAPWVYRNCKYVAVSQATRFDLTGLGVDGGRISIIHNGTPEPHGTPVARSPAPLLVVLGRLVPHKRVEVAIQAVADLSADWPDVELVIAGRGWWETNLRTFAASLGVADRVRFAGYVTEEEKHALLGSAWLALMPSVKEGWGQTIVEAGMHQTPTVAFRAAGGVTEAIVDGTTGLLADDTEDFIARVRELLTDERGRRAMGAAAAAHAARFTWREAALRFAGLFGVRSLTPAVDEPEVTTRVSRSADVRQVA